MGRFGSVLCALATALVISTGLVGCGNKVAPTPGFGVPAVIRLSPSPTASMDIGSTLGFTATALNGSKATLATTFSFGTSNPAVLTIANNGLACAGTWDNLATPVVCTPGGAGTAQVTASSLGVVSPPVTVFVHQHIDQIIVSAMTSVGGPGSPLPQGPGNCFTAATASVTTASSQTYQANAFARAGSSALQDITSTVGPFSWFSTTPQVVIVTPLSTNGVLNGQAKVTAKTPGLTQIVAAVAGTTSAPLSFETCPVQSISLAVTNTGGTTITGAKGTTASITPTIVDVAGNLITAPLTWSSSTPSVVTVSTTGIVASPGVGGASITASCITPTCNIGLSPLQAIYPTTPISALFSGTTATPFSVYVSTTSPACASNVNCTPTVVPITGSPAVAGNPIALPSVPNSLRFDPKGAKGYLGSQKGLMVLNPATGGGAVGSDPTVTGKVLAASPDGRKVVIGDTVSAVNQVFVFDTASNSVQNFLINGATAAAFSPDSLKAFVMAGANLYEFSTEAPVQAVPLPAPGSDVAFLASGAFGYFTLPSINSLGFLATCDTSTSPAPTTVSAPGTSIRPLPDGSGFVTLAPPNLEIVTATVTGSGCVGLGTLSVNNGVTPFNIGLTSAPVAFLVSSDGLKAYIVTQTQGVIVFQIPNRVLGSPLVLAGNATPIAADLSPDGQTLYVSTNDNLIHVIDTVSGSDIQQVSVPASSLCHVSTGGPAPSCPPDLLAVRP